MDGFPHEHRLRVRYAETDQMGVVHHKNYLVYFEESRTKLMSDRGCSYGEMERRGWALPVRSVAVRYRAPAYYEDELCVRTRVCRIRAASLTFESEIVRESDQTLIATGQVELACFRKDSSERRPVPLPDEFVALLAQP
jgi:acyl-CoA thioester hydrolase